MTQKIIAFVGLPGSGKSEAIEYIEKKHKLPKVYFGEVTFDEMKKRKLDINEKNERSVREDLRKKFGQDHYCKKIIEKVLKLPKNKNVLIESLYSWQEYTGFKKKFGNNFITLAIYASPKTRYKRLTTRKFRPLTNEKAQSRDYAQIENLSQGGPIAIADFTVINEGSKKDLENNLDKIYRSLNASKK